MSGEEVTDHVGLPSLTLRSGAKSADFWDPDRDQVVTPSVGIDHSVSFGWLEPYAGGETQRSLSIPVEEIPRLIAFLAVVMLEANR